MNIEPTDTELEQILLNDGLHITEELDTGFEVTAAVAKQEASWVTEAQYQGFDNDEGAWD